MVGGGAIFDDAHMHNDFPNLLPLVAITLVAVGPYLGMGWVSDLLELNR